MGRQNCASKYDDGRKAEGKKKKGMKTFAALVLALLLGGGGFWYLWDHRPWSKPGPIIAFGDSLTLGIGASEKGGYVPRLAQMIRKEIVNAGLSGDRTATALIRIDKDVLARNPGIVIVFLGGNDIIQGITPEKSSANLWAIVRKIKAAKGKVLLIDPGVGPHTAAYSQKYKEVAEVENIAFVPNVVSGIWGNPDYLSDEVHPNDAGYALIAERIAPSLEYLVR